MKNLITICLFLLATSLHSQILNPSFEEWDSKINFRGDTIDVPKNWHLGVLGEYNVQRLTDLDGNSSIQIFNRIGGSDNILPGKIQQKLKISHGLDSISFIAGGVHAIPGFFLDQPFYGFGLLEDTIGWQAADFWNVEIGAFLKDTFSHAKRLSFEIPDSIWGKEMYLTFYCSTSEWLGTGYMLIDDIRLHGDFSVNTQNIDNQQFSIFPNPAEDWLFIKNENLNFSKIEIFSLKSKLLFSEKEKDKINVARLPTGSYFLVLKDKKNEVLASQMFLKK